MAAAAKDNQLVVPIFEGQRLDRYRLAFTGSVELDPTDAGDLQVINDLRLGRQVEVRVSGAVVARPHKVTHDKDGWLKTVHGGATISVHSFDLAIKTSDPKTGGPTAVEDAF